MTVRRSPGPQKMPPIGSKVANKPAPPSNGGLIGGKNTPRRTASAQAATTAAAAKGVVANKVTQKLKSAQTSKLNAAVAKKQTPMGTRARPVR